MRLRIPYLDHTYKIRFQSSAGLSRFMEKQLDELRLKMESSSSALARFERELNVINPEDKTNIISARLLQINQEYTAAQADRVKKRGGMAQCRGVVRPLQRRFHLREDTMRKLDERLSEARQKLSEVQAPLRIQSSGTPPVSGTGHRTGAPTEPTEFEYSTRSECRI